jgi:hypothetical protein
MQYEKQFHHNLLDIHAKQKNKYIYNSQILTDEYTGQCT